MARLANAGTLLCGTNTESVATSKTDLGDEGSRTQPFAGTSLAFRKLISALGLTLGGQDGRNLVAQTNLLERLPPS